MAIVLNGTTVITNDGGYTGDGVVFADTTPANTLVTTTGGNVGVGTSSPGAKLEANVASGNNEFRQSVGGVTRGQIVSSATDQFIVSGGTGSQILYVNGAERVRIDSSGNLLVGTTAQGGSALITARSGANRSAAFFDVNVAGSSGMPAVYIQKFTNDSSTAQVFAQFAVNNGSNGGGQINGNGSSAAAFGSFSDFRLKENIESLPPQLSNILALRPVEFDYKDGSGHQIGFIAQEMQEVYSDVVAPQANGMLMITGWSKTEARLVKAIQELKAIVDAQGAEIAALKGTA